MARDEALEKIQKSEELAQARYGVLESPKSRKEQLMRRQDNAINTRNTYLVAKDTTRIAMDTAFAEASALVKKATGENITKKSGEKFDLRNYDPNSDVYAAVVKYNEAVDANADAVHDADMAETEYTATLQEITKLRFDNIVEWFEALKGIAEAKLQVDQSAQELLRAQGKSEYGGMMKGNLES